jgi:hypothetical protein
MIFIQFNRPSLETIMSHAFFTHDPLKIPSSLPSCCTHVAPDWQEDSSGRLVPVLAEADEAKYRSKMGITNSRKNEDMQPAPRSREPLAIKTSQKVEKNQHYPTQHAARPSSHRSGNNGNKMLPPSNPSHQFEIYGDMPGHHRSQRRRSSTPLPQQDTRNHFNEEVRDNAATHQIGDEISEKINKCSLQETPDQGKRIDNYECESASPVDAELKALEEMHERLRGTNARVEAHGGPSNFKPICQAESPGAQKWVTRYVDYTSKYGLGFLFNDGR